MSDDGAPDRAWATESYVEVLETVSNALLAFAVWGGLAVPLLTALALLVGSWTLALAVPVGTLGAGLSLRSRAVTLRTQGRTRRD